MNWRPSPLGHNLEMIDVDDPTTWPSEVRAIVDEYAGAIVSWSEYSPGGASSDFARMDLSGTMELEFRDAIGAQPVMLFHATRLLEHEIAAIRTDGLAPLDEEVRAERIQQAAARVPGALSEPEVELLMASGPLHWDHPQRMRLGQSWFVTRTVLTDSGLDEIFSRWGGEAISWAAHGADDDARRCEAIIDRLSAISHPAVVIVAVDARRVVSWKSLWPPFVGRLLGDPTDGEWLVDDGLRMPVADVVTPGDPGWDHRWSRRHRFA